MHIHKSIFSRLYTDGSLFTASNSNLQQSGKFEACQSPTLYPGPAVLQCYVRVLPCTGVYEKYGHGKHNFGICDYHIIVLATASKCMQAISEVESDLKNALTWLKFSSAFFPPSLLKLIAYLFQ